MCAQIVKLPGNGLTRDLVAHQRTARTWPRFNFVEPRGFEPLTSALQRQITLLFSVLRYVRSAERHHGSSPELSVTVGKLWARCGHGITPGLESEFRRTVTPWVCHSFGGCGSPIQPRSALIAWPLFRLAVFQQKFSRAHHLVPLVSVRRWCGITFWRWLSQPPAQSPVLLIHHCLRRERWVSVTDVGPMLFMESCNGRWKPDT